jgi:hypothetical protein
MHGTQPATEGVVVRLSRSSPADAAPRDPLSDLCAAVTSASRLLVAEEITILRQADREESEGRLRELRSIRPAPIRNAATESLEKSLARERDELSAAEDAGGAPRPSVLPWLPATLDECVMTSDGLYVAVATDISDCRARDAGDCRGYMKASATWSIVYANLRGERGAVVTHALTSTDGPSADDSEVVTKSPKPVAFDFDGDGSAELVFTFRYSPVDTKGEPAAWGTVLTFKGGALKPYEPAAAVTVGGARDENHDGRPDLVELVGRDDVEEGKECNHCGQVYDERVWLSRPDGTFAPPTDGG